MKLVYTVLVLAALVYAERRLIEPRLTGARLSALVQAALVYTVLVYLCTRVLLLNKQSSAKYQWHLIVRVKHFDAMGFCKVHSFPYNLSSTCYYLR